MIYPSLKSNSKPVFRLSMLSLMLIQVQYAVANQDNLQTAVMPTIKIEAMSELDPIKSYIDYDQANVTRNGLKKKIFLRLSTQSMYKNIRFMGQMI
jgi:iron complex outermembrane receptor protein